MSNVRSIRLIEELEKPVSKLERGELSYLVNRLLQIYFTKNSKLPAQVHETEYLPRRERRPATKTKPAPPVVDNSVQNLIAPSEPVDNPLPLEPTPAVIQPTPEPEPTPPTLVAPEDPPSYDLLDSIVPK